MGVLLATVWYV